MDNLKSFLGTVMTTTSTPITNRDTKQSTVTNATNIVSPSIVGGPSGSTFVAKAPAQDADHLPLKVSNSPGGRLRSESESSVASDISIMSEMGHGVVGQRPLVKRVDSEPYFWIM